MFHHSLSSTICTLRFPGKVSPPVVKPATTFLSFQRTTCIFYPVAAVFNTVQFSCSFLIETSLFRTSCTIDFNANHGLLQRDWNSYGLHVGALKPIVQVIWNKLVSLHLVLVVPHIVHSLYSSLSDAFCQSSFLWFLPCLFLTHYLRSDAFPSKLAVRCTVGLTSVNP